MEHPSSVPGGVVVCRSCADRGETTPASEICSGCERSLCNQCFQSHTECPTSSCRVATTLVGNVKLRLKPMCNEHVDELVKFACKDCKKSACTLCTSIYHRKCKSVVPFESELASIISELSRRKEELLNKKVKLQTFLENQETQIEDLEQNQREAEAGIVAACRDTKDIVTREEYLLLNHLQQQTGDYMNELKAELIEEEMSIQMNKQQCVFMEQAIKSENEVDMFRMYMSLKSDESKTFSKSGRIIARKIPTVSFIRNTDTLCESLAALNLDSAGVV